MNNRLGILLLTAAIAANVLAEKVPVRLDDSTDIVTIGSGEAGVDYELKFDGETADGRVKWMEDEDYFQFLESLYLDLDFTVLGSTHFGADDDISVLEIHDAGTLKFWDDSDDTGVTMGPTADGTTTLGVTGGLDVSGNVDAGALTMASGSITDTSGAISFGNENLSTTGTWTCNVTRYLAAPAGAATEQADGTNNDVTVTTVFDYTDDEQYKRCTVNNDDDDYDVVFAILVPENFSTWDATAALSLIYNTSDATNSGVTITVYDTADALDFTDTRQQSATKATVTITAAEMDGTYTIGSYFHVVVIADGDTGDIVDVGPVTGKCTTTR